jgi:RHS repeat-associated protein
MKNSFYISLQKTGESETIEKLRTNLWDEENRLRAVDITPDAEGVRPIAIYTYDAGGERILKHSNTSVSIYLNGKKVADTIQVDATLYPSGMTVFRPSFGGEGGGAYTKHYFAGTQRVSSKIGTTENLGDYLYDWFTQGTGGPIDVIGSSFGVLENAEQGVVQVYDELGIEAPEYDSSPVFIPVQSFVHGANENEIYWFHPDHLGSTSYITNLLGEVSQHMEYFAFGETFLQEHRSSNNSPYKFNGKELDEETGWYYYGARYYDPRVSVWLSVDPLMEQTMQSYQYAYQNPLKYVDPTGKDPILPNFKTIYKTINEFLNFVQNIYWNESISSNSKEGEAGFIRYHVIQNDRSTERMIDLHVYNYRKGGGSSIAYKVTKSSGGIEINKNEKGGFIISEPDLKYIVSRQAKFPEEKIRIGFNAFNSADESEVDMNYKIIKDQLTRMGINEENISFNGISLNSVEEGYSFNSENFYFGYGDRQGASSAMDIILTGSDQTLHNKGDKILEREDITVEFQKYLKDE